MRQITRIAILSLLGLTILSSSLFAAAATEYKEIAVTPHRQPYFSLIFTEDHLEPVLRTGRSGEHSGLQGLLDRERMQVKVTTILTTQKAVRLAALGVPLHLGKAAVGCSFRLFGFFSIGHLSFLFLVQNVKVQHRFFR